MACQCLTLPSTCSVSVPSVGLEDDLLLSLGNFLESAFPKVTLHGLRTSAAGTCYTSNAAVEAPSTSEPQQENPRCGQPSMYTYHRLFLLLS